MTASKFKASPSYFIAIVICGKKKKKRPAGFGNAIISMHARFLDIIHA
jgi:hypothetical protein